MLSADSPSSPETDSPKVRPSLNQSKTKFAARLMAASQLVILIATAALAQELTSPTQREIDPLVKASAYGDKSVWSYHGGNAPVPWSLFRPRDYGSSKITFDPKGVRDLGSVPAPGVHPRIFFSPEDLPALRKRLKETTGGREAWKNVLAYANAMKLEYDENADYAQPDWMRGSFGIHGRVPLHRIGGYSPKREDYYSILAEGRRPEKTFGKSAPASFFLPASTEAFRCLIDDDAEGAKKLAKAVVTAVTLEQERRAKDDKPVKDGEPPRPSTSRACACALGFIYDFLFNWMTPEQRKIVHDELVTLSSWHDNYGTFNNAESSRSNWATFTYWVFDLMAIEGEPGFNDLKFLGLYRGWRNFFTYSFFDSGAAYEAEGKLPLGFDAVAAFDRAGDKYGLERLSRHPMVRAYYTKFVAQSVLPSQEDGYAIFDILGSMGGGLTTPHDVVAAKYFYPDDRTIDFVYRTTVKDDYRDMPKSLHFNWNEVIASALFAGSHDPANTPEKLGLPLTFFCGQRALMMTRSSWDKNATMLTMHVRGASGGHPYRDRNGIMLAGQGRTWVTIPGKDIGGWAMNTVIIDEADQNSSTPARVVDFADEPTATFLTGDAKYCWDWAWSYASRNRQGQPVTRGDVENNNVETGLGWKLVEQAFNDFAWTKSDREIYRRPLKFNAHWIAMDGVLSPPMRQANTPVLKSFRTAGLVRGPRPYVLVVDDSQRDAMPTRYDWNLTLPADVVGVKGGPRDAGDIILAGRASLGGDGALKPGEPGLLIRALDIRGERLPDEIGLHEKTNILSLRTRATSPDFKVLMYAFRGGDPLPVTTWNADHTEVAVNFPDQKDTVRFASAASGKTDVVVSRDGATIVSMTRPVAPLADPDSDALTARVNRIPVRLAALRKEGYDPAKLPGLVAGWSFDKIQDGAFPPWPGSVAEPIPATDARLVDGPGGRQAAAVGKDGLVGAMNFASDLRGPFTMAFWVKTRRNPSGGSIFGSNAHMGISLDIQQGGMRFNAFRTWGLGGMNPASMLSSWTHLAITFDEEKLDLYRNGYLLMSIPADGRRVNWSKEFQLGAGDLAAAFADLCFFSTAFPPEAVENLYLQGKYGTTAPAG
jgi:hypothetical protein